MGKLKDAVAAGVRAFKQRYNEKGEEVPDPRPVEMPLGFRRPRDLHEMVMEAVRQQEWSRRMQAEGFETEEEANDFAVEEDDPDVQFSKAEIAMQMAEERPREKEELLSAETALREARAERRRRPVAQAADGVKPDAVISATKTS